MSGGNDLSSGESKGCLKVSFPSTYKLREKKCYDESVSLSRPLSLLVSFTFLSYLLSVSVSQSVGLSHTHSLSLSLIPSKMFDQII